ncbi:transcriptional regulator [Adhaeribacter aerolatus]|uniref:Transcriptional regulator n=1 Tax=Adhaeribacter aerolatus TaxID=670289 RepID=A0A512B2U7_9BACT|nr:AraC family transcriptional regulator [Adhaeribacter aerolatus]GEO06292.1 transcriptional regulator [Adhaeribacter aerolatus]
MEEVLISLKTKRSTDFQLPADSAYYQILLFKGAGSFQIDFTPYHFSDHTILFLSPYQHLQWLSPEDLEINVLEFHGDFYCIEYHKKEVACNGLLFNNIYLFPHITVPENDFHEILALFRKIGQEKDACDWCSTAVLKAYLQLILALCSKEKNNQLQNITPDEPSLEDIAKFQDLLEQHFLQEKGIAFYAAALSLSTNAFSKKIRKQFGKTPTQLLQDRVVLEAKKLLHLTNKTIKEIAVALNFEDEFYFSRYFKNKVGVSPAHYRKAVGISIVAK